MINDKTNLRFRVKSGRCIFIVAAKRTAFGTYGGTLKNHTATDLAVIASKAALEAGNIKPELIDHVIFGNVVQSCQDAPYLARHVGLRVGVPEKIPALTLNRLCGSGFQAVVSAAQDIITKDALVVLTGGTESMSEVPFVVRNVRFGTRLGGNYKFEDILWDCLTDSYVNTPMALTAEKLGAMYNVTRKDADAFALRSQTLWKKAQDSGAFKEEMAPVTVKKKNKEVVFDVDEHPRPSTAETLAKLPPVFKKDGLVTAGNASGVCDGAGAVVVAGEEAVKTHNLKPLARIVGWHIVGVDPSIMGIGPAPAIRGLLQKTKLKLDDIDLIEVNEAFAPQCAAVQRELKIPDEKLNVSGGAIALGHPLAASGARISAHLVHEMRRRKVKYGIGSACIGGGQGIAVLFEVAH
ncbi:unnamed protein product [Enterobius vermicularis]|uniref:3-ketoacyl-CoA thiolase, mitochondrial n=1 Tax=Enterobius vermicularis TaxID=51028 RepID=A0A3P6HW35_ENTVE|nr:unnamed protein product [Enterobius vermicularis]